MPEPKKDTRPVVACDLDGTLIHRAEGTPWMGDLDELEQLIHDDDSVGALIELAGRARIVYVTGRPAALDPETMKALWEAGAPFGPIYYCGPWTSEDQLLRRKARALAVCNAALYVGDDLVDYDAAMALGIRCCYAEHFVELLAEFERYLFEPPVTEKV